MTTELKPGTILELDPRWDDAGPIRVLVLAADGCNDTLPLSEGRLNGQWTARIVEEVSRG